MTRVTGIVASFFQGKEAPELQAWYSVTLVIDVQDWGGNCINWTDSDGNPTGEQPFGRWFGTGKKPVCSKVIPRFMNHLSVDLTSLH